MGKKGAKLSENAETTASQLLLRLSKVGDVTSRKMFGGVGIFEDGTMFGIIDSGGRVFFRAGPENQDLFDAAGSTRHGKMPYYSVPDSVLLNPTDVEAWATRAMLASRAARK